VARVRDEPAPPPALPLAVFLKQMAQNRNVVVFSIFSLIQVFHCHFNSAFFPLFLQLLTGDFLSPLGQSMLLGLSFVLPHINNVFFLRLSRTRGVYAVVRGLVVAKLLLAAIMFLVGRTYTAMLCLFIASNRIFTEVGWSSQQADTPLTLWPGHMQAA
jgi:hypothetical protein